MFLTEWSEQVPEMSFSVANFKDVRDQNTVFESLVGSNGANFILTGEAAGRAAGAGQRAPGHLGDRSRRSASSRSSAAAFTPEEDKPGADRVVLLGEGFWERRFGRDPGVVGQHAHAERRELHGDRRDAEDAARQLEERPTSSRRCCASRTRSAARSNRGNHPGIYVIGRLKPGVDVEQARTDVKAIAEAARRAVPELERQAEHDRSSRCSTRVVGDLRPALLLLLGAVAFVLLIACANVANLLLARAADRQREIAVRMALGATRGRLIRQLLTESVLLSLAGRRRGRAVLAYLGLQGAGRVAARQRAARRRDRASTPPVLLFTAAVAVLTGLVFGIVPAWRTLSTRPPRAAEGSAAAAASGPGHHRVRNALVVAEVSLALVLLVGAGLLLRSFFRVLQADAGLPRRGRRDRQRPAAASDATTTTPKRAALFERVLEKLQASPACEAAPPPCPCSAAGRARSASRASRSRRRASGPRPTSRA